jgi:SAM-dependent methyltransferase
VGCGTGEHALLAAQLGHEAWGVDGVDLAIAQARAKAAARGLAARFVVGDALDLARLGRHFDIAVDSGLFHVFDDAERARYVRSLHDALAPGGRLFLLCFSDAEPGPLGPRRIRREEIDQAFREGWRVESVEPARFLSRMHEGGARAWHARIGRP